MDACAFWRRFQGFISFPLRLQWWRLLLVGLTVLQLMVMLLVLSWFSGCVKTMLCDWFPCFIMWRSLLDFNLFKYKKRVFLNCFTFVKNLNNTDGYFWRNICPSKIKIFPTKNYPTLARPSISPCILCLWRPHVVVALSPTPTPPSHEAHHHPHRCIIAIDWAPHRWAHAAIEPDPQSRCIL